MLDAYLERIDYDGPTSIDIDTLTALHRAHLLAIPYENLDIQLGRVNVLDEDAFVDKLVRRGRGGWCYEMNGTFTMALREMGFTVTRVCGAVGRVVIGDVANASHMVGIVDLERRYVVDVGLGQGPVEPFALEEAEWSLGPMRYSLERVDSTWWRMHNDERADPPCMDFATTPMSLADYQQQCDALQTSPMSPFTQFAIAIRQTEAGFEALRDTRHVRFDGAARVERDVSDVEDYRETLRRVLGFDLGDEVDTLWDGATTRDAERALSRAGDAPRRSAP